MDDQQMCYSHTYRLYPAPTEERNWPRSIKVVRGSICDIFWVWTLFCSEVRNCRNLFQFPTPITEVIQSSITSITCFVQARTSVYEFQSKSHLFWWQYSTKLFLTTFQYTTDIDHHRSTFGVPLNFNREEGSMKLQKLCWIQQFRKFGSFNFP